MGIGYNTQKKWVFGYGYWVSCGYHTQYPIPIKKVGTDVCNKLTILSSIRYFSNLFKNIYDS